jgi:hypothetical protein
MELKWMCSPMNLLVGDLSEVFPGWGREDVDIEVVGEGDEGFDLAWEVLELRCMILPIN